MSWGFRWRPYVPLAERRAKARRAVAKMTKAGKAVAPVVLAGRQIASTFWGKAWCENLEAYSDFANRLPRGRTYIRNGSVVDLQISKGLVTALVSGSELYKIQIKIKPLLKDLWASIQSECAGKIDSLIELLQGRLSSAVMQIVTRGERGLFPTPKQIDLDCSCPDWADMCKHVAAALYGVGARLDKSPELLFLLRGVDPADLISKVSAEEAVRQSAPAEAAATIAEGELAEVFGIDLQSSATPAAGATPAPPPAPATKAGLPKTKRNARAAAGRQPQRRAGTAPKARWKKASKGG